MMTFQQSLEYGQAGESVISQWLQDRGCKVFPAYEKLIDTGKGPQLFTAQGNFVLLICWFLVRAKNLFFGRRRSTKHALLGTAFRKRGKPGLIFAIT